MLWHPFSLVECLQLMVVGGFQASNEGMTVRLYRSQTSVYHQCRTKFDLEDPLAH